MDLKIIFLDFDGVLNSLSDDDQGLTLVPAKLDLVKRLVDATGAKIVLSTSWREYWCPGPEQHNCTGGFIDLLFQAHDLQILDKTPVLPEGREAEIKAWLDQHSQVENFAVLDDRLLAAEYLNDHFVKVSRHFGGLDATDIDRAISILNG